MKTKRKFIVLACLLAGATHAQEARISTEQEACQNDNCFVIGASMPLYQENYLRQYAWSTLFGDTTLPISQANMDKLAQSYAETYLPTRGHFIQDWSDAETGGSFVQTMLTINRQDDSELDFVVRYYVFDKNTQQIRSDPFLAGGKSQIDALLKDAYVTWQVQENGESQEQARAYVPDVIPVSDNWYIAKNVVVFSYPNDGSIAPVADGIIELPVHIESLNGIIQPDILRAAANWSQEYQRRFE